MEGWGEPREVFSKGAIFAIPLFDAPIGLIAATGQAQRIEAPVEMFLWGYSVLLFRPWCRQHCPEGI